MTARCGWLIHQPEREPAEDDGLRLAIRRYEHVYKFDLGLTTISVRQHAAILSALGYGDVEGALAAHAENYRFGVQALLGKMGEA